MKRLFVILIGCLYLFMPLSAQSNKLIQELKSKQLLLQQQISATEFLLKNTRKDVGSQLNNLASLTGQIEERKNYILSISNDVNAVNQEITNLQAQLASLQSELVDKKKKYASSVQYLYKNRSIQEKLMFIFSAKNFEQTLRRLRYVREYATYQRIQAEEILKKQKQIRDKESELQQVKLAKESLLKARENEKVELETKEKQKRSIVASLQRKQHSLQNEIYKKRSTARQLNNRIDQLVSEEIERARRRAAEEASKAAEAEIPKKGVSKREKKELSKSKSHSSRKKAEPLEVYSLSRADRVLSNDFASNRGRLPIPITGPYIITSHYGEYAVAGLHNVKLDNKGVDIQGQPGAQARAIFGGKVAAVFKLNGLFNILIRHGDYISVYCNLSYASVKSGDEVRTKQSIGGVFSDSSDSGRTILHFQLRKETQKLNPENWLNM